MLVLLLVFQCLLSCRALSFSPQINVESSTGAGTGSPATATGTGTGTGTAANPPSQQLQIAFVTGNAMKVREIHNVRP
jgi:hypothetical protein